MLRFEPGATECTTKFKIMASSDVAFDKKFVLMLRRKAPPPSSGRMNLFSVVSGMTGRRECVHYVAVLGTIGQGLFSHFSESLRPGLFEDRIPVVARYSAPVKTDPVSHPASYTKSNLSFPGVKCPGVALTSYSQLGPRLK